MNPGKPGMKLWAAWGILILFLVFLGTYLTVPREAAEPKDMSVPALREFFHASIKTSGAERAYERFLALTESMESNARHGTAHLFGEVLYVEKGASGIAICDTSVNFGCYHGFFSAAVREEGLEVVSKLDIECSRMSEREAGPCRHGIGHGTLEHLGTAHVEEALEACTMTTQKTPIGGCTSGVFMEYNIPLSETPSGEFSVAARPLTDPSHPYDLCPSLKKEFQQACFHELPQWWFQVVRKDYAELGKLCEAVPDFGNRTACVSGIGNIMWQAAGSDVDTVVRECSRMSSKESVHICITHAAWTIPEPERASGDLERLCAFVPSTERALCMH